MKHLVDHAQSKIRGIHQLKMLVTFVWGNPLAKQCKSMVACTWWWSIVVTEPLPTSSKSNMHDRCTTTSRRHIIVDAMIICCTHEVAIGKSFVAHPWQMHCPSWNRMWQHGDDDDQETVHKACGFWNGHGHRVKSWLPRWGEWHLWEVMFWDGGFHCFRSIKVSRLLELLSMNEVPWFCFPY